MIVSKPVMPGEPDLLEGHTQETLSFVLDDGSTLLEYPAPTVGWTHETIENLAPVEPGLAWDALLGTHWIGSSEV
ncbi:hypothetical protein HA052_04040 [Chromobacterium haemolyticum]|uniref:Uncharacterized protein n=1 Tax=Chromobacterium fluminis TaxID=3044269 RepID=A0ABX0L4U8_9NEIS|nr:hypothetical protein [Chromobacterium haemolyticum]NHR04361.1 hypothetical protein [Chromobacterium haemolyticum]